MQENNTTRSLTLFVSSHFMFNILGKLQSEILGQQKKEAVTTLSMYSKLLRIACEMANSLWVSIKSEGIFLETYLALEKSRFPDQAFEYTIAGFESEQILVPCFILQPIVEKAVLTAIGGGKASVIIQFDPEKSEVTIDSAMVNEEVFKKHSEKYTVALDRLKFFGLAYEIINSESRILQKIKLKS